MAQVCEIVKVCPYADYAVMFWEERKYSPYVACWCPRIVEEDGERKPTLGDTGKTVECYWGQGHYFEKEESAMKWAIEKEGEALEWKIADLREQMEKLDKEIIEMERRTV